MGLRLIHNAFLKKMKHLSQIYEMCACECVYAFLGIFKDIPLLPNMYCNASMMFY